MDPIPSRILGCYLGAALGDALGAPHEFNKNWVSRKQVLAAYDGRWTDDTQLSRACFLAVLDTNKNPRWGLSANTRERIRTWATNPDGGHRAPGSACLIAGANLGNPDWEPSPEALGSGAVMRAHVYGMAFSPARAMSMAFSLGSLTHALVAAQYAGKFAGIVSRLIRRPEPLNLPKLHRALNVSDLDSNHGWLSSTALAAACKMFVQFGGSFDIVEAVAGMPGDSDTVASMVGALFGAAHGYEALPAGLLRKLEDRAGLEREVWEFLGAFDKGGVQQEVSNGRQATG